MRTLDSSRMSGMFLLMKLSNPSSESEPESVRPCSLQVIFFSPILRGGIFFLSVFVKKFFSLFFFYSIIFFFNNRLASCSCEELALGTHLLGETKVQIYVLKYAWKGWGSVSTCLNE